MRIFLASVLLLFVSVCCTAQGGARQFNGTSDSSGSANGKNIGIPGATSITIAIEEWQNVFTTGDHVMMELSGNFNGGSGFFLIDTGGSPGGGCSSGFYVSMNTNAGLVYRVRKLSATPTATAWHTWVFTITSTSANWNIYIDGVQQTLINCDVGTPGTRTFSDAQLCIMARGCNTGLWNAGKVAWWAVWNNVVLSQNEVTSLSNCQNPWLVQPESLVHATYYTGQDSPEASYSALQGVGQNTALIGTTVTAGPIGAACEELQP